MQSKNVVLVAGVHGVSGRAAAQRWTTVPGTTVYGLSRRPDTPTPGVIPVLLDLLDRSTLAEKLKDAKDVTHIVFGAYAARATAAENVEANVAILENLLDVVETASPSLRHITFFQGGKAYGADLGPFKTPAREDDLRLMPPNFYYAQEDLLRARQKGRQWHWTALRPEGVLGFGLGNPMNLGMSIAVYATISKELGLPLRFPGSDKAYKALYQVTSAEILAKATVWAGQSDAAKDEIFNITNGDYFRWQYLWPRIAEMFEMDIADPAPIPLTVYMADKSEVWGEIVRKHNLQPNSFDRVASWQFADAIFSLFFDNITSTIKARRAGFHDCIDTEEMFREFFAGLRADRIIP
jgi:nucleoside-diphosphate-sugar epimerase